MRLALIVAAAENDAIGRDGDLPWHLPGDLARFKAATLGHVVVMGSVTQRSIEARLRKPLPGRRTVVLSHGGYTSDSDLVTVVSDPEAALDRAVKISAELGTPVAYLAGGASVYTQLLHAVDDVLLTRVHAEIDGDAFMPAGWLDPFTLVREESHPADGDRPAYSFLDYRR
ncbi:dihydrofolate reductase [Actinokineospora sp. NBRC 105648]|uniref:dihydrofolate reductase n=1 Tax=Actinokineospora sp. NBRC 105648 TaxID=3032206 RepID=UPI0024A5D8C9|nr:dihydrofolate reductase [Actinokineospora sp. NBRC 105648]GLZ37519.1 dihydrofolate reductase [Actinokineospora sp. NBRC 105648]